MIARGTRRPAGGRAPDRRVLLVTGASCGIGRATALRLARAGHAVYGAARRVEAMADLRAAGGHALRMDVTDDAEVRVGVERVMDEQGRVDGLYANAGYCLLGPVELHTSASVQQQLDTNVVGVGRVVRAVVPHMRAQGAGRIAICSSAAAVVAVPGMAWYVASKSALEGLADALRMELAAFGVSVSLVQPGFVATGIADASRPTLDAAGAEPAAGAYRSQMDRFWSVWATRTRAGADPATVAAAVEKALTSPRPRRRYRPNPDARLAAVVARVAPGAVVERVLAREVLGLGRRGG